jgi:uncharacterized membrane protein
MGHLAQYSMALFTYYAYETLDTVTSQQPDDAESALGNYLRLLRSRYVGGDITDSEFE